MGTDINMYVEVRLNGKWQLYSQPYIGRNCELFNKLAGVRGSLSLAIIEPRGLPDDLSEVVTFIEREDSVGHTHTWLTPDELKEAWPVEQAACDVYLNEYTDLTEPYLYSLFDKDDVRYVFWFDS